LVGQPFPPQSFNDDTPPICRGSILLIEDDVETAQEVICEYQEIGYRVVHCADGAQGLERAMSEPFSLIILDRMLPGMDGLSVLSNLRGHGLPVPVLLLSALGDVDERVRGLKAGGDDYLCKPFALSELAARVEALLRRPAVTRETLLQVGPLKLDLIDRCATRGTRNIDLLTREFKMLEYMMRRPGQILTRAMLLEDIWNYRFLAETNLVDVHIGKLRRKIDGPNEVPIIQTIKGKGFLLLQLP
jgi:two-component system, OmpR family, response regulator